MLAGPCGESGVGQERERKFGEALKMYKCLDSDRQGRENEF